MCGDLSTVQTWYHILIYVDARLQELKKIQSTPLIIGQFNEMVDTNYGIVSSTAGSTYYVRVLSVLDREKLKPNTSIALHRHSHSVVDILPPETDSSIQLVVGDDV